MSSIGKSVPRVDGVAKVCGQAMYVDDYWDKDMLYGGVLRSNCANGLVKKIDTSRAKALSGVEAVVTYADVPAHRFTTAGHPFHMEGNQRDIPDRQILTQRVRYWGDEIAAVVAVDELTATEALRLIEVEYEEYEPVLTIEDALKAGAPEIHAKTGNIIGESEFHLGDLDKAFSASPFVFEGDYKTSMVQHCAMENHSAYAYIDNNNKIVVVTSTQIPHLCRHLVGRALGVPVGRIRVIKPYVGGGFGGKQDVVVEPLAAFLTTVVHGRPVRVRLSREEYFIASRVRHAMNFSLKTGVTREGIILAQDITAKANNGAYASHGHTVVANSGEKLRSLYRQQAISFHATTVYTNMPVAGAMRGYGIPQIKFAQECHMDDMAEKLGLDPIDFRLRNLHEEGYIDPLTGNCAESNGLRECLTRGRELMGWDEKRALYRDQTGSIRRGVGVACANYATGTFPHSLEAAGARIVLNEDGSVELQVGAAEIGQGSDTVLAQMAADIIGLPVGLVYVSSCQDTDVSPFDCGAYASRQTYVSGMAVRKAATEIKSKVLQYVSSLTDRPVDSLDLMDGWIVLRHNGSRLMPLAEAALDSFYNQVLFAPITAEVAYNARANALSYVCTFVDLEVDLPVGVTTIRKIFNVHDAGRIINPALASGQVHGGVSMGLGYALYEQMLFDPATGKPLNNNLLDYKLMTILDTPEIGAEFVQTYEPSGPFGNKSLGEPPVIPVAPAVRNAIFAATGVKFNELPMNPQRLVKQFKAVGLI